MSRSGTRGANCYNSGVQSTRAACQFTNRLALLLVVCSALFAALVAGGVFDPQPFGRPRQHIGPQTLPAGAGVVWLAATDAPFSVRASVAAAAVPYALVVADATSALYVGLDPAGYVSIWREQEGAQTVWLPWQPWVHLAPDRANEIWLDVDGASVTLRLNRELFAFTPPGALPTCRPCRVGIWRAAGSAVQLQHLTVYR